jgi:hypothetical protein
MFEDILVLIFSLLVGLVSFGIAVWVVFSGRLSSLDGMLLTAICLLFTVVFGGNLAWSVYKGEAQAVLKGLLKRWQKSDA